MSFRDFIRKHVRNRSTPKTVFEEGVYELNRRLNARERRAPAHIVDQRGLISELFDTDEPAWLIFLDAGRYDLFDQLVGEYFEGELSRAYNGGVGYTGDWCARNLAGDYGNRMFVSWVPIHGFVEAEYDEREHFALTPELRGKASVHDRLAALGYREGDGDSPDYPDHTPDAVNSAVREYASETDGGVIRYVKPHPPFTGLEELTSEDTKTMKTRAALESGDLTYTELTTAYIETYREGFSAAQKLVPDLPGRVVVTADHGTCLTCGQLFHGRQLDKHDHLTVVPWFEVSGCV